MCALLVGELYAKMGLDKSAYDKGLVQARDAAGRFDKTKMTPTVGIDTTSFRSQIAALTSTAGSLVSQYSTKIADAGRSMTMFASLPIAAGLGLAVMAASDLDESMNKVKVVFKDAAQQVVEFSKTSAETWAMSKQQALDSTATFGALLQSTGLSNDAIAEMSLTMTKTAADLSSLYNVPMADALEKLRAGLVGETEPLRTLGVMLDDATLRQVAFNKGLIESTSQVLPAGTRALAAYYAILADPAVVKAQGDLKNTSGELANQMRFLVANAKDLATSFGSVLIPVMRPLVNMLKDLLSAAAGMPTFFKAGAVGIGVFVATIGPALWAIGSMATGLKALAELKNVLKGADTAGALTGPVTTLLGKLKGIAGTIASGIGSGFQAAFPVVSAWIGKVGKLLAAKIAAVFATSAVAEGLGGAAGGAAGSASSSFMKKLFKEWPVAAALAVYEGIKLGLGKVSAAGLGGLVKGLGKAILGGLTKVIGGGGPQISKSLELVLYDANFAWLSGGGIAKILGNVAPLAKAASGLAKFLKGAGFVGVIVGAIPEAMAMAKEQAALGITGFFDELKFKTAHFVDSLTMGFSGGLMSAIENFKERSKEGVPALQNVFMSVLEDAMLPFVERLPFGDKIGDWLRGILEGAGATAGVGGKLGAGAAAPAAAAAAATAATAGVAPAIDAAAADVATSGAAMADTLRSIPKNIVAILSGRDWGEIGVTVRRSGDELASGFSDMTQEMLTAMSARIGSIGEMAGGLASFVNALATMPKKAIAPGKQAWGALGTFLSNALDNILAVFTDKSQKILGQDAERIGSIGSAAGGLGSFIGALASMPTKAIAPSKQAWGALARTLATAMESILAVFADTKGLGKQAERAGSIGSMAGGLGSFINALADMPDKAISVVPQKWAALARVLEVAIAKVLAVFEDASTGALGKGAERMGSIGSLAGGLGSLISALADLPDKAIAVVPQKWKALAGVVRSAVDEVLAVFADLGTKKLGGEATRMGSVAGMAGGLGSILSMFVDAPDAVVKIVPQKWHELAGVIKDAIAEVLEVFKTVDDELLTSQGATMTLIGSLVGPLADILNFFADAPKTAVAVVRQNWADFGDALVEAVQGILTQFDAVWTLEDLKGNAERMGFIGTMIGVVRDIADLAASLPDLVENMRKFATMDFGTLWEGIGNALTRMLAQIAAAIGAIPDMTSLQAAQEALATLSAIFADMVALSGSIGSKAGAKLAASVPSTQGAAQAAGGYASAPVVLKAEVNVSWQTLTGQPSEREKRAVVRAIKPEMERVAELASVGAF
ncbi:MAG: hypothetical protein WCP98_01115 [Actinomycetes bacterium]